MKRMDQKHAGGVLGAVIGQTQVLLAQPLGMGADSGGQGIMTGTHVPPGLIGSTSHSREGACVWPAFAVAPGRTESTESPKKPQEDRTAGRGWSALVW